MKFRTEINIAKEKNKIDYLSKIVLFGSCFTENIEKHFIHYKFQSLSNPFGILFHPIAIEKTIEFCLKQKKYKKSDLYFNEDHWLSFDHHSKFSSESIDEILAAINFSIKACNKILTKSTHVIITLGTAWVYRFIETNSLVANCHKIPQKKFNKELLSISEIKESLNRIISLIQKSNPSTSILFTVSPVRHLRDGFLENTRSKSHLHTAIQEVIDNNQVFYFPSFEIMMDDLRDYRYYKNDMLHPNEMAVEYIWEKFKDSWIHDNIYDTMKEIDGVQKALQHKPFRKESIKHQLFLEKLVKKITMIKEKYPHIKF